MSLNETNVVVFSSILFKGWGIDAIEFEERGGALSGVNRVVDAPAWRIEGLSDGDRVFLAGRSEPLSDLSNRQYPIPLNDVLWLSGDRLDSALALVQCALIDAEADFVPEVQPLDMSNTVLVVGSGGSEAVSGLLESGRRVIWAGNETIVEREKRPGLETIVCRGLKSIDGAAGRFSVVLEMPRGRRTVRAGAVVLAGEPARSAMDLGISARITALAEFESLVQGPPQWAVREGFSVALVAGPSASTNGMTRLMNAAMNTAGKTRAAVYILAAQVKVASFGLERLYGQAREAGVVFLRTPGEGPDISVADGRVRFKVYDPIARAVLSFEPDMVVVDEPLVPADEPGFRFEDFGLSSASDGFSGPDNVLFLPAHTNRRGIYTSGPARGTDSIETLAAETAGIVADSTALLRLEEIEGPRVVFDETCCAHCLSCLRICPHGAVTFTSRPRHDPVACVACGLCAARCPGKALTVVGYADRQALARMEILLSRPRPPGDSPPRVVVFGCRRSAQKAMATTLPDGPTDLVFIPLPCGGNLEDRLILKAFLLGADGVMVAVCHEDNCRTEIGGPEAARRVGQVYQLMSELGADPGRLRYLTLAPNQGVEFSKAISDFIEFLEESGPGIE